MVQKEGFLENKSGEIWAKGTDLGVVQLIDSRKNTEGLEINKKGSKIFFLFFKRRNKIFFLIFL